MSAERIHRTVSADGTELAGRVVGQGPSLVFVPGALDDGESAWEFLLPHMRERFTCYLALLDEGGDPGSAMRLR